MMRRIPLTKGAYNRTSRLAPRPPKIYLPRLPPVPPGAGVETHTHTSEKKLERERERERELFQSSVGAGIDEPE